MKLAEASIVSNIELLPGHFLLCVEEPYIATTARPGQFLTIRCGDELILRRPFSIHRTADRHLVFIFFKVVGKGTHWLSTQKRGDTLDVLGPLGNGFSLPASANELLLLAGGTGIAPVVFLAQEALNREKRVTLVVGAQTAEYLYPKEHLPQGMECIFVTDDGSYGERGTITQFLTRHDELVSRADEVYACGPLAMYQEIEKQRQTWYYKKTVQVSLEIRMGCGIGACYGCSIMTKRGMRQVCKDGPVFEIDDIIWEEVRL